MKRAVVGMSVLVGIVVLGVLMSGSWSQASAMDQKAKVERGKYLVSVMGCTDCHTPKIMGSQGPEPDPARFLSGHPSNVKITSAPAPNGPWIASTDGDMTAWAGPWGVSFAANLTPDRNTGLGIWTEEMFEKALRNGRHMGTSRPILPPMPWQNFRKLSDEDLASIYAYLRTIPAIHNRVPDPLPPAAPPRKGGK